MDDQLVGAGEGALSGAAAGSVAGPYGAAAGAVVGGVLGYMGSSKKGYSLPWDQYNQRLNQIASYSSQLEGATSMYATAVGNMYNTAFNQYMPQAAAAFAGRGLGVDSGAFGAELGRTAATLSSQDMVDVANKRIANIDSVQKQYGNAWDAMFGAANSSNKAGFENANANMAGVAQLAMGAARLGIMAKGTNGSPPTPNFYGGGNADNYGMGSDWNGGNPFAS